MMPKQTTKKATAAMRDFITPIVNGAIVIRKNVAELGGRCKCQSGPDRKRQSTAALQNVAVIANALVALASWSAAALRRFQTGSLHYRRKIVIETAAGTPVLSLVVFEIEDFG